MTVIETTAAEQYMEQLLDPRWRALRQEIIERDAGRCRSCGREDSLQVHHRQYHVIGFSGVWKKPWEYEASLLVTLCQRCHEAGHGQYQVPIISV